MRFIRKNEALGTPILFDVYDSQTELIDCYQHFYDSSSLYGLTLKNFVERPYAITRDQVRFYYRQVFYKEYGVLFIRVINTISIIAIVFKDISDNSTLKAYIASDYITRTKSHKTYLNKFVKRYGVVQKNISYLPEEEITRHFMLDFKLKLQEFNEDIQIKRSSDFLAKLRESSKKIVRYKSGDYVILTQNRPKEWSQAGSMDEFLNSIQVIDKINYTSNKVTFVDSNTSKWSFIISNIQRLATDEEIESLTIPENPYGDLFEATIDISSGTTNTHTTSDINIINSSEEIQPGSVVKVKSNSLGSGFPVGTVGCVVNIITNSDNSKTYLMESLHYPSDEFFYTEADIELASALEELNYSNISI